MTDMTDTPVTFEVSDSIAEIGLSRPSKGNAIDLPLARALRDAAERVAALSTVNAVVLFGHGDQFCVGGDLGAFAAANAPRELLAELAATTHEAILRLRSLPIPVISAVHGACAGGGIGIALAADILLAERTARFVPAYTAAGLSPDCGVTWALPRVLGHAVAADLILTNRSLDGDEAGRLGLVSRVVEPDAAREEAIRLASSLALGPHAALNASVRLMRAGETTPLPRHLEAEAASISALIDTTDGREGLNAFLAKRPPVFAS